MFLPILWLAGLTLSPARGQVPISFRNALVIGRMGPAGRVPVVSDPIISRIVRGEPVAPVAGDSVIAGTRTLMWRGVQAGPDGQFSGDAVSGGYLYTTYDSDVERPMVLEAAGDSMVYVNSEPRPGDSYETGYLRLPVLLRKGTNEFLFAVGRGNFRARLLAPRAPYQLDTGDVTRPNFVEGDHGIMFGGVVIINSTTSDANDLSIACSSGGEDVRRAVPRIPAMSMRKVRFDFPAGAGKFQLVLLREGQSVDSATVAVEAKSPADAHMRTFESSIDGSVQYYAILPSTQPDKSNALILSLHGASVEALGQASAYTAKSWATLVAPTNRRPYGFDWEDWGRMDGMEVLDLAGASVPHDPKRVVVTGHSMGGHGTWSLGTLFPSRFGATAPSAAWISFWSYAGGWTPQAPTPPEEMIRRAMSPSDTLARVQNLTAEHIYILHGDQDENVPVAQARKMRSTLAQLGIEFGYHEEPGAPHWWGNRCMDYPDLMSVLENARISDFRTVDFTTPDPGISAECGWIRVLQQIHPRQISHAKGDSLGLVTDNIRALKIESDVPSLKLDGQTFTAVRNGTTFLRGKDSWAIGELSPTARSASFCGPLKHAFNERFVFVYGTTGTPAENVWSRNKARYDAETFYYRGNGAVETVSDVQFLQGDYRGRNAVVYGNIDSNRAWKALLVRSPIRMRRDELRAASHELKGAGYASMFVYPSARRLVVAIGGTGLPGMRMTDRMPVFTSGVAYPDWTIFGPETLDGGTKGIVGAGFFGPDWSLGGGDAAWLPPRTAAAVPRSILP